MTIKGDLSVSGIKSIQKQIKDYQNNLISKLEVFTEKLASEGVQIARANIVNYDAVFTGELLSSLYREPKEHTQDTVVFVIKTDSQHAAFVEFGTGQNGMDTPYPYPLPDGVSWNYATGKTIRQNSKTGRYYWFYPGKDGKWHYTEGLPARPFMYQTSNKLKDIVEKTAKEVFKE